MADEARFTGDAIDRDSIMRYSVTPGTAIVKGAWFTIDTTAALAYTAVVHAAVGIAAGIAVEDRDSDDTQQDSVGFLRKGNVLCVAGAAITVGSLLVLSGTANRLVGLTTASGTDLARIVGVAKSAAAAAGDYFLASIDIY